MAHSAYLIGVDTGGTYTDAAIIEAQDHRVLARAKAITTKGDLAIGVTEAINLAVAQLPQGLSPQDIGMVSVSTTLATNAVVEGHGSPVAVVLVGFDARMVERTGIASAFPGLPIICIAGGHDHNGEVAQALDLLALQQALNTVAPQVDAFAVASTFAVRNAAHEQAVREHIVAATGKPVTVSSELSSALDAPRRALTAALNARLIARVSTLIDAVQRAMAQWQIQCPLMIVKGDGTLALAETVATRPIETVLSGPAASLVGAQWLSGLGSFILSDMGGTTTDLGVLQDGRPRVNEQGAEVGGWRTMVRAIDVRTIGLGGDSEIHIGANGRIGVGPQRIVPVALLGARYPEVLAMLEADLADVDGGSALHGHFVLLPFGASAAQVTAELSDRERELLQQVTERPQSLRKLARSFGAQRTVLALKRKGLVQIGGLTPSDAAHVLGLQHNWSTPAAMLVAQLGCRLREMKLPTPERTQQFARDIWSETVRLSARAMLDTAVGEHLQDRQTGAGRLRRRWPTGVGAHQRHADDSGGGCRRPGVGLLRRGRPAPGLPDRVPGVLRRRQRDRRCHRRRRTYRRGPCSGRWQWPVRAAFAGRHAPLHRSGRGHRSGACAGAPDGHRCGAGHGCSQSGGAHRDPQATAAQCHQRRGLAGGGGNGRGDRAAEHGWLTADAGRSAVSLLPRIGRRGRRAFVHHRRQRLQTLAQIVNRRGGVETDPHRRSGRAAACSEMVHRAH